MNEALNPSNTSSSDVVRADLGSVKVVDVSNSVKQFQLAEIIIGSSSAN